MDFYRFWIKLFLFWLNCIQPDTDEFGLYLFAFFLSTTLCLFFFTMSLFVRWFYLFTLSAAFCKCSCCCVYFSFSSQCSKRTNVSNFASLCFQSSSSSSMKFHPNLLKKEETVYDGEVEKITWLNLLASCLCFYAKLTMLCCNGHSSIRLSIKKMRFPSRKIVLLSKGSQFLTLKFA